MTEELQRKLQKLLCTLADASAEIEQLAFEHKLPELEKLMEKCEREIERPMQKLI
ncbi:hypothetical protein GCM10027443_18040 [Pontibacter brevis]